MRIGHFAQPLLEREKTGIGWYAYNLIEKLNTEGIFQEIYGFDAFYRNHAKDILNESIGHLNQRDILIKINPFIFNRLYYGIEPLFSRIPFKRIFDCHVDLYHSHNYFLPYKLDKPSVITIYDMVYKKYPETMDEKNRIFLEKSMERSARDSSKILTISQNSKNEIIEYLGVPEDKVEIAYPGFDSNVYKQLDDASAKSILNTLKIQKSYILFLGTLEPRKNLVNLIEAYKLFSDKYKDIDLVIAGKIGWKSENVLNIIKQLNPNGRIIHLGYVTEEQKVALYNGAVCFVFPSLYEGFGMPLVEAMACGCPVISSNVSSIPEVVGDAGILVDPYDIDALCDAMTKIVSDNTLRGICIEKGLDQKNKFTWEKSIKVVKNMYSELIVQMVL